MNVINPTTVASNENISHLGPSSSTNIDKQAIEKQVRCLPIEDIISIGYSTEVKKEYETSETRQERVRPLKPKLGCCGKFKECIRENFCCCPSCPCKICKPISEEKPQYDTFTKRNVTANRMILIEMKCIQHSNIDIPTHVRVLPADEKQKFYTENFNVETIYLYLVNNNETEQNDSQKNLMKQKNFVGLLYNFEIWYIFFLSSFFKLFDSFRVIVIHHQTNFRRFYNNKKLHFLEMKLLYNISHFYPLF